MDDSMIVELYWQRNENAIAETNLKYGSYCYTIAHNILRNNEDSEECINDTWLHAWNAIPPQKPGILRLFLARITRNLSFNRYNAAKAAKRGGGEMPLVLEELSECIAAESDIEEEVTARELQKCINRFVSTLPDRERNLFVRRYFFVEKIGDISKRYGITENNVRVILSRTRAQLKAVLKEEGFDE